MNLRRDKAGQPLFDETRAERIGRRFLDMVGVMARLRAECPWDRKQTPDSLKRYVLEEAFEVVDAIERQDWDALCEELGDHLLQVLFQAQIQQEQARFEIADVLDRLIEKMVHRHPHVFGELEADEAAVVANWELLKRREKGNEGLFDGFTHSLPALLASHKISAKAAKVGFDWPDAEQIIDKIQEELGEVRQARAEAPEQLAEELGDLLFAVSNLTRKLGFEPEDCLRQANRKFVRRFTAMERLAADHDQVFAELDLEAQESYWQRVKRAESNSA